MAFLLPVSNSEKNPVLCQLAENKLLKILLAKFILEEQAREILTWEYITDRLKQQL